MWNSRLWGLLVGAALVGSMLAGCASQEGAPVGTLIYEETVSPNEDYVDTEEVVVTYTVRVYQEEAGAVRVEATSNSGFFEPVEYEVAYDQTLAAGDVSVVWMTLMGSTEATEEDQLVVAQVSLLDEGAAFSQRTINFISGAIDVVVDAVNQP